MTFFPHTNKHSLNCQCTYCKDVDPNKSIDNELEKYIDELLIYAIENLNKNHTETIYHISQKILLLGRYFPDMELPAKHSLLLKSL